MKHRLPELQRWLRLDQKNKPINRWSAWARSLTSRFETFLASPYTPAMVMIRPRAPIQLHHLKGYHYGVQLAPQINLAYHFHRQSAAPEIQRTLKIILEKQSTLIKIRDGQRPQGYGPPPGMGRRLAVAGSKVLVTPHPGPLPSREEGNIMTNILVHLRTDTHLHRLLVREWVEEHRRSTTVVLKKREHQAEPAVARELPGLRAGPGRDDRSGARMAAPTLPSLEQLTDQVMRRLDERVRAHRERLGKSFY